MTRRNGLLGTIALAVAGAIVATMVVSCGIRPSVVIPGQEAPHGVVTGLIVYLLDHGSLRAVSRPLPPTNTPDKEQQSGFSPPFPSTQAAINALLAGPTASETAGGLTSDLPAKDVAAYVLPSGKQGYIYDVFVQKHDSESLSQHAVDQVVCTVSAAFISTGNLPDGTSVLVRVVENKTTTRQPQACPATP
jgi:hypothetical protein